MTGQRDATIDVAKGMAIILIVLGHVLRGLAASGLIDPASSWYAVTDTALYEVHLAAFVFLAGLFVPQGVERRGGRAYLRFRLGDFLYVYVVWTLLQGVLKVMTASLINTPLTPMGVLKSFWEPDGQLWYLPFFALLTAITVFLRPWRSAGSAARGMAMSAALGLLAWGDHWGALFFARGWALAPFFMAGVIMGHQRFVWLVARAAAGWPLALSTSAAFIGIQCLGPVAPTSASNGISVRSLILGVAGTILGLAGLIGWARLLAPTLAGRVLVACGRASMQIFLAHIAVAAGLRVLLVKLHVENIFALVSLTTLAGVVIPLCLALLSERWPYIKWIFTVKPLLAYKLEVDTRKDAAIAPSRRR